MKSQIQLFRENKSLFLLCLILSFFWSCSVEKEAQIELAPELISISEKINPTQVFQISSGKDTIIQGNQGTQIFVPANALIHPNGNQIKSPITLNLKEIYSISDMILNGLSTTSDNQLLGSSGMINIKASIGNELLEIADGSAIKIDFKKIVDAPAMRTFLGVRDSTGIVWILDENNIFDTVRFQQRNEYIRLLDYGAEEVTIFLTDYGIVGNDTILLDSTAFEFDPNLRIVYTEPVYDSLAYQIHSTKLNWINCDYFVDTNINIQDISLSKRKDSKTLNYLVFSGLSSIMMAWDSGLETSTFINIPKGSKVAAIGIARQGEDYFFAHSDVMLNESGQMVDLKYEKSSLTQIIDKIEQLNRK